jgi:hypothetical protein
MSGRTVSDEQCGCYEKQVLALKGQYWNLPSPGRKGIHIIFSYNAHFLWDRKWETVPYLKKKIYTEVMRSRRLITDLKYT